MSRPWHSAIAYALTGEALDLGVQPAPDLAEMKDKLDATGWPPVRIADHARATVGRTPWPHPVPDALRAGLGAAQLHAAIRGARDRFGLAVLTVLPPSRRTQLDRDELRLVADVPPHFGRT